MKKIANSCMWGPMLRPFWKIGGLPICPDGPIWKNFNLILHRIRIKNGFVLWKKLPTHVFGPENAPFLTNGVVAQSDQIGPILTFKNIFLNKIKIQRGIFYEKNCHLMLLGPHVAGRFG